MCCLEIYSYWYHCGHERIWAVAVEDTWYVSPTGRVQKSGPTPVRTLFDAVMYSKGLLIITLAFAVSGQSSSTVSRTATTPAAIGTPPPISPCILQCVDLAAAQNHCTG